MPAYQRYFNWLWGALHGDLGVAMTNKRVIIDELLPRLYNTLFLAGYAALIAIPLSVGLGILAAINEGKFVDKALQRIDAHNDIGTGVLHCLSFDHPVCR